ncbi:molecular chaperone [Serratia fonticola]|uniref:fimbrial biogenesis chaperone n=1 Tax=Serratia fonticola TaxID=47917 RepID=UPI00301BDA85
MMSLRGPAPRGRGRRALHCGLGLLCLWGVNEARAAPDPGINLSRSRLVFSQKDTSASLTLTNNTDSTYLMQSRVREVNAATGTPVDWDASGTPTFLVVPPLVRMAPGAAQAFRILRTQAPLPRDRESVFFVSAKAIPSVAPAPAGTGARLVFAVASNIKLFYRPSGLPEGGVGEAVKALRFHRANAALVMENPTPFYISFASIKVNGIALPATALQAMAPPLSEHQWTLPPGVKPGGGVVQWQAFDEQGIATPPEQATLR